MKRYPVIRNAFGVNLYLDTREFMMLRLFVQDYSQILHARFVANVEKQNIPTLQIFQV